MSTRVGPVSVVGVLESASPGSWLVRRRDGTTTDVAVADIEAWRVVPPGRAQRASVGQVEQAAALGWRALETARLGDWLLRASDGFTARGNSALAVGSPGCPPAAALDRVTQWYADRGLPPLVHVPEPGTRTPLVDALAERGWTWAPTVHVMTAELAHVLRAAERLGGHGPPPPVALAGQPDDAWLRRYRTADGELPPAARRLLVNHPAVVFASVPAGSADATGGDAAVAVARVAVDGRWAGLFGVEVAARHRRGGLATAVSAAALREAGRRGARQVYLQVTAGNDPAVATYRRLGFGVHHDYATAGTAP